MDEKCEAKLCKYKDSPIRFYFFGPVLCTITPTRFGGKWIVTFPRRGSSESPQPATTFPPRGGFGGEPAAASFACGGGASFSSESGHKSLSSMPDIRISPKRRRDSTAGEKRLMRPARP
jgi:hypothetical protein